MNPGPWLRTLRLGVDTHAITSHFAISMLGGTASRFRTGKPADVTGYRSARHPAHEQGGGGRGVCLLASRYRPDESEG